MSCTRKWAFLCYNEVMTKWRQKCAKWLDEFLLAFNGAWLAMHKMRFWLGFSIAFLLFGILMNLLSCGSFANIQAMFVSWAAFWQILSRAILALFGVNIAFVDWLMTFSLAVLQGVLIGLITLLWHKKQKQGENIEKVGIAVGLITLSAGCPTCGTTLIMPLISTVISAFGGVAANGIMFASVIARIITFLAIIIAILALKKIGLEVYVTIINEKYLAKKRKK